MAKISPCLFIFAFLAALTACLIGGLPLIWEAFSSFFAQRHYVAVPSMRAIDSHCQTHHHSPASSPLDSLTDGTKSTLAGIDSERRQSHSDPRRIRLSLVLGYALQQKPVPTPWYSPIVRVFRPQTEEPAPVLEVSPLLDSRVVCALGARLSNISDVIVMSGGKEGFGPEATTEAAEMRKAFWKHAANITASGHGHCPALSTANTGILEENESTSTQENVVFSMRLIHRQMFQASCLSPDSPLLDPQNNSSFPLKSWAQAVRKFDYRSPLDNSVSTYAFADVEMLLVTSTFHRWRSHRVVSRVLSRYPSAYPYLDQANAALGTDLSTGSDSSTVYAISRTDLDNEDWASQCSPDVIVPSKLIVRVRVKVADCDDSYNAARRPWREECSDNFREVAAFGLYVVKGWV